MTFRRISYFIYFPIIFFFSHPVRRFALIGKLDSPLPLEALCFGRKAAELQQSLLCSHIVLQTPAARSPSNHNNKTTLSHSVYVLKGHKSWMGNDNNSDVILSFQIFKTLQTCICRLILFISSSSSEFSSGRRKHAHRVLTHTNTHMVLSRQ